MSANLFRWAKVGAVLGGLMVLAYVTFCAAFVGGLVYVAIHFIRKFW